MSASNSHFYDAAEKTHYTGFTSAAIDETTRNLPFTVVSDQWENKVYGGKVRPNHNQDSLGSFSNSSTYSEKYVFENAQRIFLKAITPAVNLDNTCGSLVEFKCGDEETYEEIMDYLMERGVISNTVNAGISGENNIGTFYKYFKPHLLKEFVMQIGFKFDITELNNGEKFQQFEICEY